MTTILQRENFRNWGDKLEIARTCIKCAKKTCKQATEKGAFRLEMASESGATLSPADAALLGQIKATQVELTNVRTRCALELMKEILSRGASFETQKAQVVPSDRFIFQYTEEGWEDGTHLQVIDADLRVPRTTQSLPVFFRCLAKRLKNQVEQFRTTLARRSDNKDPDFEPSDGRFQEMSALAQMFAALGDPETAGGETVSTLEGNMSEAMQRLTQSTDHRFGYVQDNVRVMIKENNGEKVERRVHFRLCSGGACVRRSVFQWGKNDATEEFLHKNILAKAAGTHWVEMEMEMPGKLPNSGSRFWRMRLARFGGKGSSTVTPFLGTIIETSGVDLEDLAFDFREHEFKVESKTAMSTMGMPSELDIMVSALQLSREKEVPSSIVDGLDKQASAPGSVSKDARVYYSVLDKSHGDMAIWFLYVKGFILGVQVFYPKVEHLWRFTPRAQARVGRYQGNTPAPAYGAPGYGYAAPGYGYAAPGYVYAAPGYGGHTHNAHAIHQAPTQPRNGRAPMPAPHAPAQAVPAQAVPAQAAPAQAAATPPTKTKAVLGQDAFVYSPGYMRANGIGAADAKKVPKTILVKGIPGAPRGVTLAYDGGARFKNAEYRMEPYSEKGGWWWALFSAKGNTRLGRKTTEQSALMSLGKSEMMWSFQKDGTNFQGPGKGIQYETVELTITNAENSRSVVPMRELASYLPLQPRRLAAQFAAGPRGSDDLSLAAIMSDLSEIKRALNGASLLSMP
jgi:hypothetical protein